MSKVGSFALAVVALLLAVPLATAQPEGELDEKFRLLAQIRYELSVAELDLQRVPESDSRLPQRRQALTRLKRQFDSAEREIEVEGRDQVVYVSSGSLHPGVASYYAALRARIEQVGTDNFPRVNGQPARGTAAVLVELDVAGNVKRIEVVQSSSPELMEKVQELVNSLSPFQRLPSGISSTAKRVVFVASFAYRGVAP